MGTTLSLRVICCAGAAAALAGCSTSPDRSDPDGRGYFVDQDTAMSRGGVSNYVFAGSDERRGTERTGREDEPTTAQATEPSAESSEATASREQYAGAIDREKAQELVSDLRDDLLFDTGSTDLKSGADEKLGELASYLRSNPDVMIRIEGYADSTGSSDFNKSLSQQRAEVVSSLLKERGVGDDQLRISAYGERKPVASNRSEEGRALNRRVELHLEA
jgi:outer membrane protein OmpA-like peptidoglycan-associated protein